MSHRYEETDTIPYHTSSAGVTCVVALQIPDPEDLYEDGAMITNMPYFKAQFNAVYKRGSLVFCVPVSE